jgi:type I restriction enzyme, R subunit
MVRGLSNFPTLRDKFRDLMDRLAEKRTIPMVQTQLPLIADLQTETWWATATISQLEQVRLDLRDLIQFIDRQQQAVVYTDFTDQLGDLIERNVPQKTSGFSPYQYRRTVEAYIRANQDFVAITKLRRNLPLTETDLNELERMLFSAPELERKERFQAVYGPDISLKRFIRELVGLDRAAAKQSFSRYIENANLTANQIRFVDTLIDYLTQNGIMDPGLLYESPFTDIHTKGLDGIFDDTDADGIVSIVRSFNEVVDVKFGA